jgi:hypothetical protein
MAEAHSSKLSVHPGSSKMHQDLKLYYIGGPRWKKKSQPMLLGVITVAESRLFTWSLVYCNHSLFLVGSGNKLLCFIVGLPTTEKGFDSIWVIVDRLTKSTHFIPVKSNYHPHMYADIYFQQVLCLHGVPKSIVSDRGSQSSARF